MYSFAEIAFNLPLDQTFTYDVALQNVSKGMRVETEFNGKKIPGIILDLHNNEPACKIKKISKIIDSVPIVTQEQIDIAYWMKDYYLSTIGESLFKMIPQGKRARAQTQKNKADPGYMKHLNQEQQHALDNMLSSQGTHLLHGITGSGKTEVYIHLLYEITQNRKQTGILLVPEITLTVQMIDRLKKVFADELALLHSGLKISERFNAYLDLLAGRKKIAIGTRSAVFAPVEKPGIIIIDEEHDNSYKDQSSPRYHARQIAFFRSQTNKSLLVLGSATPSLEVYYQAKSGQIHLNTLTHRPGMQKLPQVTVKKNTGKDIIGNDLLFEIKKRLDLKQQVILLLNRRGHSPLLYLKNKKEYLQCPNCTSHLCFHANKMVACHMCGYKSTFDFIKRNHPDLELQGAGTQKLEEYLLQRFKDVKLERLDQDSARNKEVLATVIQKLVDSEIDILTGTQMISKGLDAANVTLVGVINAGIGLGLPDFRAQERVFSMLTQVSGRAGRSDLPGAVVIETFLPDHPVIQLAIKQDYISFYNQEIRLRKDLFYPPFSRMVRLVFRSKSEEASEKLGNLIKQEIDAYLLPKQLETTIIMGPAPCPFYKIDSNFRNHIIIKTREIREVKQMIASISKTVKTAKNTYLEIDIDPVDLL